MSRIGLLMHAMRESGFDELRRLDESVRVPLPTRRRIAMASLAGGTGCTTVAARLTAVLAARRSTPLLAIDAQAPSAGIASHLEPSLRATLVQLDASWPDAHASWQRCLAEHAQHDLALTDWGSLTLARLRVVAARSHVVCLVTPTERPALQRALDVASALHDAHGTAFVIAGVDLRTRSNAAGRAMIDHLPMPSVRMPHDGRLRRHPSAVAAPRTTDQLATLRLASTIVDAASGSRRRETLAA